MFSVKSLLLALAAAAVTTASPAQKRATTCNGRAELCNRSYGDVTVIGAHNSFSVSKSILNFSANQNVDVVKQLDLGVRLLQGSAHNQDGHLEMCHTSCLLEDGGKLIDYLKKVKGWLDAHPNEVLTLLFTNPDKLDVKQSWQPVLQESGIESLVYTPPRSAMGFQDWPTLGQMIDSGKRVVIFMDYDMNTSEVPYILPEFDNIWENQFSVTDSKFPCKVDRTQGDTNNHMYMINHSLNYKLLGIGSVIVPDRNKAKQTNSVQSILANVDSCKGFVGGRKPKFILLDWVDVGEAFKAADQLNGF